MSNLLQKTINNACRKWLLPQAASGFRLLGRRLISTSGPRCPELASSCRSQFSSGLFSVVHTGTGSAGSFQLCLQGKMEIVISFPNYFPPFYTYVKFSPRLVHFPRIDDLRIAGVLRDQQNIFPHSGHWRRTSARPRKLPGYLERRENAVAFICNKLCIRNNKNTGIQPVFTKLTSKNIPERVGTKNGLIRS